jgi:YoeB-like toxin of bacterial type II toxin-antitoxin system
LKNLEFDAAAFEDLAWWVEHDRAQALRIIRLIRDVQREPFSGAGKPEPLKHELKVAGSGGLIANTASFTTCSQTRFEFSPAGITTDRRDRRPEGIPSDSVTGISRE